MMSSIFGRRVLAAKKPNMMQAYRCFSSADLLVPLKEREVVVPAEIEANHISEHAHQQLQE